MNMQQKLKTTKCMRQHQIMQKIIREGKIQNNRTYFV